MPRNFSQEEWDQAFEPQPAAGFNPDEMPAEPPPDVVTPKQSLVEQYKAIAEDDSEVKSARQKADFGNALSGLFAAGATAGGAKDLSAFDGTIKRNEARVADAQSNQELARQHIMTKFKLEGDEAARARGLVEQGQKDEKFAADKERLPGGNVALAYAALAKRKGIEVPPGLSADDIAKLIHDADSRRSAERTGRPMTVTKRNAVTGKETTYFVDPKNPSVILGTLEGDNTSEAARLASLRTGAREADAAYRTRSNVAQGLKDLRKTAGFVGPLGGRAGNALSWAGITTTKGADSLRVKLQSSLNQYLKALSGATVTPQEEARLNATLPQMTDDDEKFNLNVDLAIEEAEKIANEKRRAAGLPELGDAHEMAPSSKQEVEPNTAPPPPEPTPQDKAALEWYNKATPEEREQNPNVGAGLKKKGLIK